MEEFIINKCTKKANRRQNLNTFGQPAEQSIKYKTDQYYLKKINLAEPWSLFRKVEVFCLFQCNDKQLQCFGTHDRLQYVLFYCFLLYVCCFDNSTDFVKSWDWDFLSNGKDFLEYTNAKQLLSIFPASICWQSQIRRCFLLSAIFFCLNFLIYSLCLREH